MTREQHSSLAPTTKTEQEQKDIAPDIAYEWEMLCWTFHTIREKMGEDVVSETQSPYRAVWYCGTSRYTQDASAMLEPFLLHARNIREFLYQDSALKDDVLAVHFFDKPNDWTARRPAIGEYLKSLRERLNKALAHVSYTRRNYRNDDGWNVGQIKRELEGPWNAFIDALPAEKRQWFEPPW